MAVENQLRVWIVNMIDNGLSVASRKRYVEKLSSLYKEYVSVGFAKENPFESVRNLCELDTPAAIGLVQTELAKIERIFDEIMSDAASKPELAVFLYLLFNASSDIESAINLTTEEYRPDFRQLDDVVKPGEFHHRRKYVFDLKQNRKRMPQLVREIKAALEFYFRKNDIEFHEYFSHEIIVALWMAKARQIGVNFPELKQIVDVIPPGYEYLRFVESTPLDAEEIVVIKHRVAEAFSPSGKRWYALKLRRGTDYETFAKDVKAIFSPIYDDNLLFYPQQEMTRKVSKRIITDIIPVIPNIVFFHINPRHVEKMDKLVKKEKFGWVFRYTSAPDSDYSVIDAKSMACFQRMIGVFTPDVRITMTDESPVGVGRKVLITGGIMAGYEGEIFDIKEGSNVRSIYIKLSEKYLIKAEVKVEEYFVKAIG